MRNVRAICLLFSSLFLYYDHASAAEITYQNKSYPLYPQILNKHPRIPSPATVEGGIEIVLGVTKSGSYTIFPVTQENGLVTDYDKLKMGKGRQVDQDSADFPTLAATGLHSDVELLSTKTITGIPVSEITASGRPDKFSRVGFMAADEDIVSVLRGDNELVRKMNLTHPQVVKPLFHFWNLVLKGIEYEQWTSEAAGIEYILYNGRKIYLKWGGRGWQRSIFNDDLMGAYHLEMWRELSNEEKKFLAKHYADLSEAQMNDLMKSLSYIHTGEMVPYYINWYGFYEGHTDFRADPISIASIFGLKTIETLERAFPGELYNVLTDHFIAENIGSLKK